MIKALFTDLDGTIVLPDGTVSASVKAAIDALNKHGVTVSCVTGRSFREVDCLLKELNITSPSIFYGGAAIINPRNGKTITELSIDKKTLTKLLPEIVKLTEYVSFGEGKIRSKDFKDEMITQNTLSLWIEVPQPNVEAVLSVCSNNKNLVCYVNDTVKDDLVGVQVNNVLANKEHSVLRLMDYLGIDPSNVATIGNDFNDVPMFKTSDYSIVMNSAPIEVKARAKFTVADVHNDGFAEAVKKYILTTI